MKQFFCGIDLGSTTAKIYICDEQKKAVFSQYIRHNAKINEALLKIFSEVREWHGDMAIAPVITGSAGMGVAERCNIPFLQEVVVSVNYIKNNFRDVSTLIEIGGEDSKVVFFKERNTPEVRMNGSCAGGTGAFIDQMAALMHIDVMEFNELALNGNSIYPIASRCGVFGKTDVQALMSRKVSRQDIAYSVFHAVASQVFSALCRGREITPPVMFAGGPLTFYSALRKAFCDILQLDESLVIHPEQSQFLPAMGCACHDDVKRPLVRVNELIQALETKNRYTVKEDSRLLEPLFKSDGEYEEWKQDHERDCVKRVEPEEIRGEKLFLGVDSGSTTTKIVLIDEQGRFVAGKYVPGKGDPLDSLSFGLNELKEEFKKYDWAPTLSRSCVTGYGEDFLKAALGIDEGIVETVAHYRAAKQFDPGVSFIIDIGGQDMKAIFIDGDAVSDIQINEACSSGCGSFLETFAHSMNYTISYFSEMACLSPSPFDLGTRCTVFMNSKVKEALRDGAGPDSISSGLAYSVIRNALYKVLKLRNLDALGETVIAQGGTFYNPAVLRALELTLGRRVIRPDISGMMGAYGAALTALQSDRDGDARFQPFLTESIVPEFKTKEQTCRGCENYCEVTKIKFSNGAHCFTGNRCERIFSNSPRSANRGENLFKEKLKLLFPPVDPDHKPTRFTYGIPRALNFYEDYPFWSKFLSECGFGVELSDATNYADLEKGLFSVVSDNICYPAKVVHSHIYNLADKKVDRIFYPVVVHSQNDFSNTQNTYNCPVITGYADVIRSSIDPESKFQIPVDTPAFSFSDPVLFIRQLQNYFSRYGLRPAEILDAYKKGMAANRDWKLHMRQRARNIIETAREEERVVVVLAGRPYHSDPMQHHGIPDLLSDMGVDVIPEDVFPLSDEDTLQKVNVLTQWSYSNRLYAAAQFVREEPCAELVQLTSFGCGPDAISVDEVRDILHSGGKIHTLLKIDEISNLGAAKIRLRSMLEAVRERRANGEKRTTSITAAHSSSNDKTANVIDKSFKLIAPHFSPFYSSLMPAMFKNYGYDMETLPPQDHKSIEFGLKHINQEMCYPAILIAGDIVRAFAERGYDPEKTAVVLSQTGGQCRASSYVSLVKKALSEMGYGQVPVLTFSTADYNSLNELDIDLNDLVRKVAIGVLYLDALLEMYLATVVREIEEGSTLALYQRCTAKYEHQIKNMSFDLMLKLLRDAVDDFNALPVSSESFPVVGIVGEIFVKYNMFAGANLIDWLIKEKVEVRLPSLQNFFLQEFLNDEYNRKNHLKKSDFLSIAKVGILKFYVGHQLRRIKREMSRFRFAPKEANLRKLSLQSEEIASMANQSGEGWLLIAEMIAMIEDGVNEIVVIQPFGCISNHITGKGIEKKLMEMFPGFTPLFLDMDAGSSEANIINRIRLLLESAKEGRAATAAKS